MGRRYRRVYARFRVALVSAGETGKFEQAGSVVDVCQHGLRVQTGPRLIPGQVLHLFHEGHGVPAVEYVFRHPFVRAVKGL